MRPLLVVGVKLIGVMVLYWALQHIPAVLYNVALFLDDPPVEAGYVSPGWQLTVTCLSFLFAVCFGAFLLFRGELLAVRLPLSESSFELPDTEAKHLLGLGIIIAGLLIVSNAAPKFLLEVYIILTSPQIGAPNVMVTTLYGPTQPIESLLQVGLAGVLIFRSGWVVKLVTRYGLGTDNPDPTTPLHSDARENTRR